jgi:hypothetical protein
MVSKDLPKEAQITALPMIVPTRHITNTITENSMNRNVALPKVTKEPSEALGKIEYSRK